jgi:ribosomal protein S13
MAYILSTNLRDRKKLKQELASIRGMNRVASLFLFSKLGLNPKQKVGSLTSSKTSELLNQIYQKFFVGSELDAAHRNDMQRFVRIGVLRGIRYIRNANKKHLEQLKRRKGKSNKSKTKRLSKS